MLYLYDLHNQGQSKASLYFDNANKSVRDTEIETTIVQRHSQNITLLNFLAVDFLKSSAKCVCLRVSSFLSMRCYTHFSLAKFIRSFVCVTVSSFLLVHMP
jgi:hypothetical protein